MIPRAHYRGLALAMRSALQAEFAPVLARLDAIAAALEVHLQYPVMFVDTASPAGDRSVLIEQRRGAVYGVTASTVTAMERAAPRAASEAGRCMTMAPEPPPRRRRKSAPKPQAEALAPATPEATVPQTAGPSPAAVEDPAPNTEELMRDWLAGDLRRERMTEDEIESRMASAETRHLLAACNARRAKRGLPAFEMPA